MSRVIECTSDKRGEHPGGSGGSFAVSGPSIDSAGLGGVFLVIALPESHLPGLASNLAVWTRVFVKS